MCVGMLLVFEDITDILEPFLYPGRDIIQERHAALCKDAMSMKYCKT